MSADWEQLCGTLYAIFGSFGLVTSVLQIPMVCIQCTASCAKGMEWDFPIPFLPLQSTEHSQILFNKVRSRTPREYDAPQHEGGIDKFVSLIQMKRRVFPLVGNDSSVQVAALVEFGLQEAFSPSLRKQLSLLLCQTTTITL